MQNAFHAMYLIHTKLCMEILPQRLLLLQMNVWLTCDFTSFLTVLQSYQDDDNERLCNGTPFTTEKISPPARIELGPLDQ